MTLRLSPIYARGARDHDPAQAADSLKAYCRHLWHDRGKVFIDPDDVTDEWGRQWLINEANRLYGKRGR